MLFRPFLKKLQAFFAGGRLRVGVLLVLLCLSAFLLYLDVTIRDTFEGKRFSLPARVYGRPLELYPGLKLSQSQLTSELKLLGYRESSRVEDPGSFRRVDQDFEIVTRPFDYWDRKQSALFLRTEFKEDRIVSLGDFNSESLITLARLDPPLIGGIYPGHNEDRALIKLDEVPPALIEALIAVEDRKFYSHRGIDPRGIARAIVTMVSGGGVQGGSTITQQLVKNFFLSSERTLQRKFTEVLMAILLELHYSKAEILETYANEIYLAQDGNRAIHGFGLASHFYFDVPLSQLELPQAALLVGLVKGPSYYDPRRHPERALERRNLVLQELSRQGKISQKQFVSAKAKPLGVISKPPTGTSKFPAFLELVHRQLRRDYHEDDLRSEGLRIFTTFDPQVQHAAEQALTTRLTQLEKSRKLPPHSLEGAVVVTGSQNGEVQAVLGGRDARFEGFNRALDAQRPVGSLLKPVIYLTALEQPKRYTLISLLDDSHLVWRERGIKDWEPSNYDKKYHGDVPLRLALANSYNISTARLGLELGVATVLDKVHRLGIERELPVYASSLLGAQALTPMEVTQLYQTLAGGGYRTALRAIREVLSADGKPLQRYPLAVEQVASPAPVYLLTTALQGVVQEGTAQGLQNYLSPELGVAGKTGTTDGLRDSWFAGFTGDRVAVVWIGRDDNEPTGLTGASGAMTVWGEMMTKLDPEPLAPPTPEDVELIWIDSRSQLRVSEKCAGATKIPFIKGSEPAEVTPCVGSESGKKKSWFRRLFE
jgi:penicillin-binding protein 1B